MSGEAHAALDRLDAQLGGVWKRDLATVRAALQAAEAERDHYRFHFDQEQERAEKAERERDEMRDRIPRDRPSEGVCATCGLHPHDYNAGEYEDEIRKAEARLREAEKALREIEDVHRDPVTSGIVRAYFAAKEQP